MPSPFYNDSELLITFEYLEIKWGTLKLVRLARVDNPEDDVMLKDRVSLAIQDTQNELLGYFGYGFIDVPVSISTYVKGILPTFVEYRLNPIEPLKEEIDVILRNMLEKFKGDIDLQIKRGCTAFGMFVV
jgi:hypothetical protein